MELNNFSSGEKSLAHILLITFSWSSSTGKYLPFHYNHAVIKCDQRADKEVGPGGWLCALMCEIKLNYVAL